MKIEKVIKSKFNSSFHKAYVNVFYTSNFFHDIHTKIFKPYGIQSQHFNILRILKGKKEEFVTPGYIKSVMLDKGRDLTRLIDKMVEKGWIERCICPDNKRKINLTLTQSGSDIVDEISNQLHSTDADLRSLSDEEYEQLSNLLDKMRC